MSILLWQIEATARNFGEQVVKDWLYQEALAGRIGPLPAVPATPTSGSLGRTLGIHYEP